MLNTAGANRVTLNASGREAVHVGNALHTLDEIGVLVVNGGAGTTLILDDRANKLRAGPLNVYIPLATTYGISDQNVTRTSFTTVISTQTGLGSISQSDQTSITYRNIASLSLYGGSSNAETVNVLGTHANVPVTVYTGPGVTGTNTVNVGSNALIPSSSSLDLVDGLLSVIGQGSTALNFNDQGRTAAQGYAFLPDGNDAGNFYRNFGRPIYFSNVAGVTLHGGSGGNFINVFGTPANIPITLYTGTGLTGSNTVNVGSNFLTPSLSILDLVAGFLTVIGQGSTALNINDQGTSADKTYNVTAGEFTRASGQPAVVTERIAYSGLGSLVVRAGSGNDLILVKSTAVGVTTIVNGGDGDEQFVVHDLAGLDGFRGPLALHGEGGNGDFLVFDESLDPAGHTYTLTADRLSRSGIADITFGSMVKLNLYTSRTGADTVNVESVATNVFTPIALGNGDKITLGKPVPVPEGGRTLQDIHGAVRPQSYGNGPVAVVVDNSGDTKPRKATFTYDPAIPGFGHILDGLAPAPIYFQLDAAASLLVKGGIGDDSFQLPNVVPPVPLTLDGGGGTNTLDYSSFTSAVMVNLQAGTATAAAGGIGNFANVLGGAGDDVLIGNPTANEFRGGAGNDILLGLEGSDKLFGNAGRDILIGGLGADGLDGGSGDDVLLGGYTSYDTQVANNGAISHNIDLAALQAIMQEWANGDSPTLSPQDNYKNRCSHLRGGGGLNGSSLLSKKTVFDDAAIDKLFGGDGLDWFLLNKKQDGDDRVAAETETSI